ncbi:unnamed protein product [Ranitomeya imitator]|uniref:Uncharacterized protein n=1 Tax=Ranitomeya imitator TaxID=111125 RepID=A0ABN9LIW9_9NEOB|nr:unnamed protein product [Ranitomeya imitator]
MTENDDKEHIKAILIWSLVTFQNPEYNGVAYPKWGVILGFLMVVFCLIWIPIVACVKIIQAEGNLFQRIASCCRPTATWGPALPKNRNERYQHMKDERVKNEDKEMEISHIQVTERYTPRTDEPVEPEDKGVEIPDITAFDNPSYQSD